MSYKLLLNLIFIYPKDAKQPLYSLLYLKGFTLLELLIVGLVIGILMAVSVPAYVATVDKFRYGQAKIQMNCMQKELLAYRTEKGFFPKDVLPDETPTGVECFLKKSSGDVPFDSQYDYESWGTTGGCYIQITFFGKNGQRDGGVNQVLFPTPGLYEDKGTSKKGDDLVLSLGVYEQSVACQ